MTVIYLTTPHGQSYHIRPSDGAIKRLDQPDFQFSTSWTLRGISSTRGWAFGHVAYDLAGLVRQLHVLRAQPSTVADAFWRHKNGTPKYTVLDWDHGHRRAWGNTKFHGIYRACLVDAPDL